MVHHPLQPLPIGENVQRQQRRGEVEVLAICAAPYVGSILCQIARKALSVPTGGGKRLGGALASALVV